MAGVDPYIQILRRSHKGLEIVKEYKFHPGRKWRFDYAFPALRIAVEIDGGVWTYGRHNNAKGYIGDMEKLNAAASMGWLVLRFTTEAKFTTAALALVADTIRTRMEEHRVTVEVQGRDLIGVLEQNGRPARRTRCSLCPHAKTMRYADGHFSTKCDHPDVDKNTTGDIRIIDRCPLKVD